MRHKNRRWLFVWAVASFLLHIFQCELAEANTILNSTRHENSTSPKELRSVFSPRMDYEQWTPLGRGDPLRNDPTYDYVPPVLERVHYWMEPAMRKPDPGDSQKTEILLLGVSSKKPSVAAESRRDSYDPFIKFVDGPKFQTNYQRLSRPHYQTPYSYYSSPFYKNILNERPSFTKNDRVPYTMLMPPPVPTINEETTTTNAPYASTTQSSVTIQESNLIYQSSTSAENNEWNDEKYHTVAEPSSLVTWRTPLPYNEYKLIPKNQSDLLMQYVPNNSTPQNTKTDASFEMTLNSDDAQISGPDIMYKGQVSDGVMDMANTYVNIGKPEAQVHTMASALGVDAPIVVQSMAPPTLKKPITLQTLQTMQTMQPPPEHPTRSPLATLLAKEATPSILSTMVSMLAHIPKAPTTVYTTTPPPSSTQTTNSLTTDPLFKNYKQPSEPLRGPMYLIIQGHSKVKTYGPSKQIHGINIQEINEIPNTDYKDEYQVKHLHTYKKKPEEPTRMGRSSNLKTLSQVVQTGFGAIDYANRRHDVQETELVAGFDVAPEEDVTSEVYHKGIVEEGKMSRKLKEA